MSADLTCQRCGGDGNPRESNYLPGVLHHCPHCNGTGRRRPELREWDTLVAERDDADASAEAWSLEAWQLRAERDRYHKALYKIVQFDDGLAGEIARTALTCDVLDSDPERSTPLMVSKYPRDHHRDTALVYDDERDSDPDLAERTRRIRADE